MTMNEKKEIFAMQKLLDNAGKDAGVFHYRDFFDADNMKIVRGTHTKDDRVLFLMPDNPESSELDWWIMYAVNTLKMADFNSVWTYLHAEKRLHPELMFTLNDPRIVKRRLNFLARLGFLVKYIYVIHTDVSIDDAQAVYKKYQEKKSSSLTVDSLQSISLDDEYMDAESEEEMQYMEYSSAAYSGRLTDNFKKYYNRANNGAEVLNEEGKQYQKFFGEDSEMITLYSLEEEAHRWVKDRFGANVTSYTGNQIMKMTGARMGYGAVGYVASVLSSLPTYHSFKTGRIMSKKNGNFNIPAEMEFRVTRQDGQKFSYNCGIFKAYCVCGNGRLLPSHEKANLFDTIYCIKNYIGIKGVTKTDYDGFCIVVVNDTVDLLDFLDAMKKIRISDAELNRIFFTGEGIVSSDIGVNKVIGIRLDEENEDKFTLYPVRLPIIP